MVSWHVQSGGNPGAHPEQAGKNTFLVLPWNASVSSLGCWGWGEEGVGFSHESATPATQIQISRRNQRQVLKAVAYISFFICHIQCYWPQLLALYVTNSTTVPFISKRRMTALTKGSPEKGWKEKPVKAALSWFPLLCWWIEAGQQNSIINIFRWEQSRSTSGPHWLWTDQKDGKFQRFHGTQAETGYRAEVFSNFKNQIVDHKVQKHINVEICHNNSNIEKVKKKTTK